MRLDKSATLRLTLYKYFLVQLHVLHISGSDDTKNIDICVLIYHAFSLSLVHNERLEVDCHCSFLSSDFPLKTSGRKKVFNFTRELLACIAFTLY